LAISIGGAACQTSGINSADTASAARFALAIASSVAAHEILTGAIRTLGVGCAASSVGKGVDATVANAKLSGGAVRGNGRDRARCLALAVGAAESFFAVDLGARHTHAARVAD